MPTFIAVHKWKPEDAIVIMKEMVSGFTAMGQGKMPQDVTLHSTYMRSDNSGAFCVWSAPSRAALEEQFRKYLPVCLRGTEFIPSMQSYPPTVENNLALMQMIVDMASKK